MLGMRRSAMGRMGCALVVLMVLFGSGCGTARAESGSIVPAQPSPSIMDPATGEARDSLSASAAVSPRGMVVPQSCQVYLTIVNSSTDPVTDIRLYGSDGKLVKDVGTLSGVDKSSYVFSETTTPTNKQLKAGGIGYVIKYLLANGEERELSALAPIVKLKAEPSVDFTRSPSSSYAQPGEEITITYRIKNTGNVALKSLIIKDALCGEITRIEELAPGKKMSFTRKVVIEQTVDSRPQVSFAHAGSDERKTVKLDPLTVYLADELLELSLTADKSAISPGQMIALQLKLTNKGNVSYDKLEIADQTLGPLGSLPTELSPGEDYLFTKRVTLKSTTTFLFSVNGRSAGGNPVSSASNMLTVAVMPVVDSIRLTLSAEPSASVLSAPGPVTFQIRIHNEGELDIRNVTLSERGKGKVKELAVAAPGETLVEETYNVDSPQSFLFMAEISDAQGDNRIVMAPEVDIDFAADGAQVSQSLAPSATAILGITHAGYQMDEGTGTFDRMVLLMLIVLVALVLVFAIGGMTRWSRARRIKRQRIKRIKRSSRNARLEAEKAEPSSEHSNTGVYKKIDIVGKKA